MRTASKSCLSSAARMPAGEVAVTTWWPACLSSRKRASMMSVWSSATRTRVAVMGGPNSGATPGRRRWGRPSDDPPVLEVDDAPAVGGVLLRVGHLDDGGPLLVELGEEGH